MGLVPEQDKQDFWATTPEPVGLPFTEGVRAVFEAGRLTDQSFSTHVQLREPLANQFQRMRDLGIGAPELPWPLTDRTAEDALAWVQSQQDAILARRSADNGPPDPFLQTADELRQGVKDRVQEAQARASRAGTGASLVGGAGVGVTDIFNLATLPFGAAKGASLLTSALTEAGLATISQLGVEAASLGAKERAGVDVTLGGVAERVATTAVGAGALVGLFHGIGRVTEMRAKVDGYRRGVAEGTIKPTRELDEAANALQDHIDTIPPLSSPAAEAAHFKATQAAVDVLRAEDPTMRASAVVRMEEAAREAVIREAEAAARGSVEPVRIMDEIAARKAESARAATLDFYDKRSAKRISRTNESVDAAGRAASEIRRIAQSGQADPGTFQEWALRTRGVRVNGRSVAELRSRYPSMFASYDQELTNFVTQESAVPIPRPTRAKFDELMREAVSVEARFHNSGGETVEALESGARDGIIDPADIPSILRRIQSNNSPGSAPLRNADDIAARFDAIEQIDAAIADDIAARFDAIEQIDAAIAREAESPTPPVVEVPIDAPLAQPTRSIEDTAMIAEMRNMAEARSDIRVEVEFGDEVLSGNLADVMARLDQEEADLGDTVGCVLGGLE